MILRPGIVRKRSRRPLPWVTWMTWLTSWTTSCIVLSSAFTPPTDRCGIAQSRCVQNPACLPVLRRYLTFCSDLIDGPPLSSTTCWPRCRRTLPLLLHIPDGRAFVGCDCQLNAHCLEQRQRLQSCGFDSSSSSSSSSSSVNPLRSAGREHGEAAATTTCTEARRSCVGDKACQDALTIANVVCAGVERKGRCDRPCRNSLRTLYSVNHGRQLRSCRCDDLDPDPEKCSALRQRTKTLCQKRRSKQGLATDQGLTTTITPSMSTHHPRSIPTPHRHLPNASIDFRMFQRSGSDAIRTGSLVTAGTLRTASASTVAKPADRNARMHVPRVTSHVTEVEKKMAAAASGSAMKRTSNWNFYSLTCWILPLLIAIIDDWTR